MKRNPFSSIKMKMIFILCLVSGSIIAQKINPDTLNIDQLNLYKDKAVKLRNTGIFFTFSGMGIVATGFIIGNRISNTPSDDPYHELKGFATGLLVGMAGIATIVIGVPLYAIGGNRYSKAELALKKFNIKPDNSMALGVGITLRF